MQSIINMATVRSIAQLAYPQIPLTGQHRKASHRPPLDSNLRRGRATSSSTIARMGTHLSNNIVHITPIFSRGVYQCGHVRNGSVVKAALPAGSGFSFWGLCLSAHCCMYWDFSWLQESFY